MRFGGLRLLSSLPAERLEAALQREHVSAVLPVSELGSGRATVLAATPGKLAIATLLRTAGHDRWIIRWAPWDAVRMPEEVGRSGAPGRRVIDIGGKSFGMVLGARAGHAAVRDFRRCLQGRRQSLARRGATRTA
jgi:hypothetical protein